jgi:hypothetical protein
VVISIGHMFNISSSTDLVGDAFIEDEERVEGSDMFIMWGNRYDSELQKL